MENFETTSSDSSDEEGPYIRRSRVYRKMMDHLQKYRFHLNKKKYIYERTGSIEGTSNLNSNHRYREQFSKVTNVQLSILGQMNHFH